MRITISFLLLILILLFLEPSARAFDWVPTEEEIKKYRQSWNPFSEGPLLLQSVDVHPHGQLSIRPFLFSSISENRYENTLSFPTDRKDSPVHNYAVSPLVTVTYGLADHFEIGAATSLISYWSKDSAPFNTGHGDSWITDTGMGDFSLQFKYRSIVQDPDTARPSVTLYSQVVLPTSRWAGTERPPGGFAPLGRLPATRFGELGLSQGISFRKNLKPFRVSGGVFYTYAAPGSDGPITSYVGDTINTRLILEHFLDDKQGLAYNIELITVHTATWRADGHAINRGVLTGSTVIGIEPAIQFKFSDTVVGAAGVLFTIAGQNAQDAIYPNFSIQWYWNKSGKTMMR